MGTKVETVKNWKNDSAFLDEDLNVNKKVSQNNADIRMVGKFDNAAEENWSICINSRGLVSLFDADGMMASNLDLVLTNARTNEEAKVVIFPGGAMNATAIAMSSGSGGGDAGSESPTSSESPTGEAVLVVEAQSQRKLEKEAQAMATTVMESPHVTKVWAMVPMVAPLVILITINLPMMIVLTLALVILVEEGVMATPTGINHRN
ncbi:hypothetical protein NON20_17855 [Synechocystis sp. B12]|nr:hypothetical protein NON20_17855 [Synechocystis sp. B12]